MKKKIVLALAVSALISGCEATKEEVMKLTYNLIIHNTSSLACSTLVINSVAKEEGYTNVKFHQENNSVTCADYGKTEGDTCEVTQLDKGEEGYDESYACVIGTDTKPTKNGMSIGLHSAFVEAIDLAQ